MLGWFRALMPREERFFELFTRHAQVTVAGAVALRALLTGSKDVAQCCKEISQREAEADELTREVLTALRRTFITPLDRGDIKDLITSMDDAIDQMNQTAKVITLFELRAFERPMQDMGEIIVLCAASKSWRRLRGTNQSPKVIAGVRFENGSPRARNQGSKSS